MFIVQSLEFGRAEAIRHKDRPVNHHLGRERGSHQRPDVPLLVRCRSRQGARRAQCRGRRTAHRLSQSLPAPNAAAEVYGIATMLQRLMNAG
jgi:hypothetical protein